MNGKLLSPKQDKNERNNLIWKVFKEPWPYWIGGILLAMVNILYFALTGEYWSITTNLARWGGWVFSLVGLDISSWEAWNYYEYRLPWLDPTTWSNLGIIIGAFIAILFARQFRWKRVKNKRQIFLGLLGGWLMGYGARVAVGCNIGGLYSSISSLAVNGWLYLPFIVLGVFVGSKIVSRWLI